MLLCGFQIASLENVFSPDFSVQVLLSFVDSEPGQQWKSFPSFYELPPFPRLSSLAAGCSAAQ